MAHKAALFGDLVALKKLQARRLSAAACKKIGREVIGFDEERWNAVKRDVMLDVLTAKFEQHPKMKRGAAEVAPAHLERVRRTPQ